MGQLHERGLSVPRPLDLLRDGAGWEIHYEFVRDAHTLAELLGKHGANPLSPEKLARSLGALLGTAHATGLEHGDLHAGNLLLDRGGRPWMIDFTQSTMHARLPTAVMEREMVALTSDAREFVSLRVRRLFFVAWRRCLLRGRPELESFSRELASRIEVRGLERRREALIEHADRWLRVSGLCDAIEVRGQCSLLSREALSAEPDLRQAVEIAFGQDPAQRNGTNSAPPGFHLELDDSPESLWSWQELGRASQHALPTLRPVALQLSDPPQALYLRPEGAIPVKGDARDIPELAPALEQLRAQLSDRGLRLEAFDNLWRVGNEALLLGPGSVLLP